MSAAPKGSNTRELMPAILDRVKRTWPDLPSDDLASISEMSPLVALLKSHTGESEAAVRTWLMRFTREGEANESLRGGAV
jgi:hypothetical protein